MDYDREKERRRAFWLSNIIGMVAITALLAIYGWMAMRIADEHARADAAELSCPDPLLEMAEDRTVVHALDRCSDRLDEEQQDNFDMKDQVDHWSYIARITNTVDEEINCMLLIERATRDFREQCEDDLYVFQAAVDEACWCPYEAERWWW
jgi:hypothetical protein